MSRCKGRVMKKCPEDRLAILHRLEGAEPISRTPLLRGNRIVSRLAVGEGIEPPNPLRPTVFKTASSTNRTPTAWRKEQDLNL